MQNHKNISTNFATESGNGQSGLFRIYKLWSTLLISNLSPPQSLRACRGRGWWKCSGATSSARGHSEAPGWQVDTILYRKSLKREIRLLYSTLISTCVKVIYNMLSRCHAPRLHPSSQIPSSLIADTFIGHRRYLRSFYLAYTFLSVFYGRTTKGAVDVRSKGLCTYVLRG